MPTGQDRIHKGFQRLAIIVGVVFALVGALLFGLVIGGGVERDWTWGGGALWLGFTALSFGLGWGITRTIGWVIAGFFSD